MKKFIEKINVDLLSGDIEKIIEVTYSYENLSNGFFYNLTLFKDFGKISYKKEKFDFIFLKKALINKLNSKLTILDKYISELKYYDDSKIKSILMGSLKYIKNILKITLGGIDFELEKAGFILNLPYLSIKNKIFKIENLEYKCFGEKLSENKYEMRMIYNFLSKVYSENKGKLELENKKIFLEYLYLSSRFLDKKFNLEKNYIKEKTYIPKEYMFNNKNIKRNDFIDIYNYILKKIYNFPQKCKITLASSIYDGEKFLEIPNNEKHKEISYEIFLNLISHEIESHYVNSYNGKIIFGNFRGAKNLEKEEGLAKIMEYLLLGYNIKNISPEPEYFPKIFFSEILNGTEFYKFLNLYSSIHPMYRSYGDEFLRQKRNYPLNYIGGQHKDITYGRGSLKIIKYLKDNNDFSMLFLGKVGFQDINKLKTLIKGKEKKVIYPIFIGDILRQYIISKEKNKNFIFNENEIASNLEKRYNFNGIEKFNLEKRLKEKKENILKLFSKIDKIFDN